MPCFISIVCEDVAINAAVDLAILVGFVISGI